MTGLASRAPAAVRHTAPRLGVTRISAAVWMYLHAPGLRGTVLSVHPSAINVACGGWLLTVAAARVGGLPNGLLLDAAEPLDRLGVRPGTLLFGDGQQLHLPGTGRSIPLAGATSWAPQLPPMPVLPRSERARRIDGALCQAAAAAPALGTGPLLRRLGAVGSGMETPTAARAAAPIAALVHAVEVGDPHAGADAASCLIGLGPGATPSGDDLLVGLLAGLAATRHPVAPGLARLVASRATGRTTLVAEAFLRHAGRLEFAERVHWAVLGVLAAGARSRGDAVAQALAWGASSGADLLVGLLIGLHPARAQLVGRLRGVPAYGLMAA